MNEYQEIYTKGNHIAVVRYDPAPDNPREEYEHLGVIYYNSSRYTLGDEIKSAEEVRKICRDADIVSFPVYAQIHGDVSLSLAPYNDPFDSGGSGIYCVERSKLEEVLGEPYDENNPEHVKRIEGIIQGELKEFTSYLNGEVYAVGIYEKTGDIPGNIEELDIHTLEACGRVKMIDLPIFGIYDESMKAAAMSRLSEYVEETTDKQTEEETCGPC